MKYFIGITHFGFFYGNSCSSSAPCIIYSNSSKDLFEETRRHILKIKDYILQNKDVKVPYSEIKIGISVLAEEKGVKKSGHTRVFKLIDLKEDE